MKQIVILLVPVLLVSCSLFRKNPQKYPWRHLERTTLAGYRVAVEDQGTQSIDGPWKKTLEEIHAEFDQSVERAAEYLAKTYKGPDKEVWMSYAALHRYRIADNAVMISTDGQTVGGQHIPKSAWGDLLWLVYYQRVPGGKGGIDWDPATGAPPPWPKATTPPWTIKENPKQKDNWRYGKLDKVFHTLTHELGHHGWWNFQHGEWGWDDAAHRR